MIDAVLKEEHLVTMQAAIDETFERNARLRKVIPEVSMPGALYGVMVPTIERSASGLGFSTKLLRRPISLQLELKIRSEQVDDDDNVMALVKDATTRICNAEDRIIAYGGALVANAKKADRSLTGIVTDGLGPETEGLLVFGNPELTVQSDVPQPEAGATKVSPGVLLAWALETARADLEVRAYFEPHTAILGSRAWKTFRSSSHVQEKRIEAFGEGFVVPVVGDDVVPQQRSSYQTYAVILGRSSAACDLVRVMPPRGSFRGYDDKGALRYVIENKFFLRIKDVHGLSPMWVQWKANGDHIWALVSQPTSDQRT